MRKGTGRKLEEVDIDREANGITLLTACRHPSFELADQGSPKSQKLLSLRREIREQQRTPTAIFDLQLRP